MKLKKILEGVVYNEPIEDICVESIATDTRKLKKGGLFVALRGSADGDGHKYIDEAKKQGASFIVAENSYQTNDKNIIKVNSTLNAMPKIASNFYKKPSEKVKLIGVVGTNGKTTISYIIENILIKWGKKVGVIGTINYRYNGKIFKNDYTTPEALDVQRILSDMAKTGVEYVVMEVSSHAIALKRVKECSFDAAIFSNFSQDHLDFHKTIKDYWECKKSFFEEYLKDRQKFAIINTLNSEGTELSESLKQIEQIKIGKDIKAEDVKLTINGIDGVLNIFGEKFEFKSNSIGSYNLENILCAVGLSFVFKVPYNYIIEGIEDFSVPGRVEKIETKDKTIFIDYAHTPDALEKVLQSLTQLKTGRIITVFGCGGGRDKDKRKKMGKISEKYSDFSIITSDNPRDEEPISIIEDVVQGFINKEKYIVKEKREEAFKTAIDMIKKGDTLLIAGKGHEDYQIIKGKKLHFDDKESVLAILGKL